jgi:hypothetical protein
MFLAGGKQHISGLGGFQCAKHGEIVGRSSVAGQGYAYELGVFQSERLDPPVQCAHAAECIHKVTRHHALEGRDGFRIRTRKFAPDFQKGWVFNHVAVLNEW